MRCPLAGACTNSPCARTSPLGPRRARKPWVADSGKRTAMGAAVAEALVSATAKATPSRKTRTGFRSARSMPAAGGGSGGGGGHDARPPRELHERAGVQPQREGHEESDQPDVGERGEEGRRRVGHEHTERRRQGE